VWNLNVAPSNVFNGWLYSDFSRISALSTRVISYMESGAGTINELPEREFRNILGGAYFMRAQAHFFLLHAWGRPFDAEDKYGIVLHTDIVKSRDQINQARSKPSEVYASIEQDLKKAEDLLFRSSELQPQELGRPTRGAATALLGKIYLFQKKYNEAEVKFQQFIDENPDKKLLEYYGDNFHGKYENGPESVFEVQFADMVPTNRWQGGGTGSHFQIYSGGHGMGRDNFGIPPAILSNFDASDIRLSETVYMAGPTKTYIYHGDTLKIRDTLFFTSPPMRVKKSPKHTYTPKKYISNHRDAANTGGLATDIGDENQMVMRVAEVYMLYAETLAQVGKISEGSEYLNRVIRRARGYYPTETSPFDYTGNDLTSFMNLLMEEKRKEFIGEQIRWFDVIRWGIGESELLRVPGRVAYIDRAACLPIPTQEMANNKSMVQNPGYLE
jgi:tetratricopeptide (TPR) repeat protein